MSDIQITANLSIKTCHCGTIYAVPNWVSVFDCPLCARRLRDHVQKQSDENYLEVLALRRSNAALRGTISRLKGESGREF